MHAFPCGTLSLDFVGTLRARRDPAPAEMLGDPAALDAWFLEAGVVDVAPGADHTDISSAIELREAIYAAAAARLGGSSLPAEAVTVLNRWSVSAPVPVLLEDGFTRRRGSAAEALATVARNAVDLLGGEDAVLMRECARPGCTQVYVDRSRGARREWCSMRTCGNRVKASQFRARQRTARAAS
ncbi:MAG: ABATE domain-containing protein [Microbacterium sp.]|jgi:predicted RNA-binding Zn ribbon-like protein|nr:ABATE domain-containing protein [Microbacterium sp.]